MANEFEADMKRESLKVLTSDLLKGYGELANSCNVATAQAVTARTLLVVLNELPDNVALRTMFDETMIHFNTAAGMVALSMKKVLDLQAQVTTGVTANTAPGGRS